MYNTISNFVLTSLIKVKYDNYDKYDLIIRQILCDGITGILCIATALIMRTMIETIAAAVIIIIIRKLIKPTKRKHAPSLEKCTIYSTLAISGTAYIAVYLQNYITVALAIIFAGIISLIFIERT